MKKFSLSLKHLLLLAMIPSLFLVLLLLWSCQRQDQKAFHALTRELFLQEMTTNTLNMHYTLAFPENFGITDYEPVLPVYQTKDSEISADSITDTLNALKAIRVRNLSKQDAYTYQLLLRQLENSRQLKSFSYYGEPLSPSSGIQSQLPILLAEYTFRSRKDVEDYLSLLDQTDAYFASLLTYEQEKAAAGHPMSVYSCRQVKKQCDTIVTKDALEQETHFLQTTFEERLNGLLEKRLITPEEAGKYTAQNNRLLRTVLQPAYEALADGLFVLEDSKGASPLPTGLASYPDGKEYYRYLLISNTGSYRSMEEIKELLRQTLQEEYTSLCSLVTEYPSLTEHLSSKEYALFPCEDAASMLADLQKRMRADFPELPAPASNTPFPSVEIKTVSPDLENYSAPAFYLTAPLDDTDNNVIYINKKNSPSGLELYTTLAHEGYPGHLYQTVYHNRNFLSSQDNNPIRHLLWYGGYLEGWALYVEFYGYDYAGKLLKEHKRDEDALCVELEKHNRSLLLCLYSTLDVMIHYDNASREDVAQTLSAFGIQSSSSVNAVYNYIADEPCNYLKYYLGYLELLELKKEACEKWGTEYSDYAFHQFLLNAGPSDFPALRNLLQLTNPL